MPGCCFYIEYRLLHLTQTTQTLIKDGFNLKETSQNLRPSLTSKVRNISLVAFLASSKQRLTFADLKKKSPYTVRIDQIKKEDLVDKPMLLRRNLIRTSSNLDEVFASLNECVDLSEDTALIKNPANC